MFPWLSAYLVWLSTIELAVLGSSLASLRLTRPVAMGILVVSLLVAWLAWRGLTGEAPPTVPPSAADYTRAGLPWFDWYSEEPLAAPPPPRPSVLRRIRSVLELSRAKGETVLPENESFPLPRPVRLRRRSRLEGTW